MDTPRPLQALRIALSLATLGAMSAVGAPGRLDAQDVRDCTFLEGTSGVNSITLAGGEHITYLSTPRIACPDGVRISADSAVNYSAQSMTYLMGNVHYRDGARTLRSDQARYFSQQGRLQASGHLFVRDTVQGSTIEKGFLIYLRKTSFRDQDDITVTPEQDQTRPTAVLYMKPGADTVTAATAGPTGDSAGAVPVEDSSGVGARSAAALGSALPDTVRTPYHVEADRLHLKGDSYFNASGDVVIVRDSLTAHSQIAEYDQLAARLRLEGSAHLEGTAYDMTAGTIDLGMPGGQMRSVRAVHEAVLEGEDLRLTAPVIRVFTTEGSMDRLVAVPLRADGTAEGGAASADTADAVRPVATAQDFVLTADSIDVNAPGQVLDRIFASGAARGDSSQRDSLNVAELPEIARTDWLEGDTVIATFVRGKPKPGQPPDSAEYQLNRLIAHGNARSLYRLPPSDSTARPGVDPPSVSYIVGTRIEITMTEGEVDSMNVEGPVRGWQLEPKSRRAVADSTARPIAGGAPPDTMPPGAVPPPPDTARAGGAAGRATGPTHTPVPATPSYRTEPALSRRDPPRRERGRRWMR